jgi:hypothetical protein
MFKSATMIPGANWKHRERHEDSHEKTTGQNENRFVHEGGTQSSFMKILMESATTR